MPQKRCGSGGQQWPPFTGTSPKSLSSHMSDRAHMRGRVLHCTRRRSGKPCDDRGNLIHLVAVDRDHARFCTVLIPQEDWSLLMLLRRLRNDPQSDVFEMSPTEQLKSFRRIRRGDRADQAAPSGTDNHRRCRPSRVSDAAGRDRGGWQSGGACPLHHDWR